ncbi:hypothetical protein SDC9_127364 [bioreactor metagenome]|uniref:Uncharacterized protein n=1 Tax=bioreactor metagenome TaxID=1076179 RepID=A0A645CTR9_9ZZZZ
MKGQRVAVDAAGDVAQVEDERGSLAIRRHGIAA